MLFQPNRGHMKIYVTAPYVEPVTPNFDVLVVPGESYYESYKSHIIWVFFTILLK